MLPAAGHEPDSLPCIRYLLIVFAYDFSKRMCFNRLPYHSSVCILFLILRQYPDDEHDSVILTYLPGAVSLLGSLGWLPENLKIFYGNIRFVCS
jgi:hypothetical protein